MAIQDVPEIREVRTRIVERTLGMISGVGAAAGIALGLLAPAYRIRQFWIGVLISALAFGLRKLVRHRGYAFAAWGFIGGALLLFNLAAWTAGGLEAPVMHAFLVMVILAGLLLGPRGGFACAALAILATLAMAMAQGRGVLPHAWVTHTPWSRWVLLTTYIVVVAVFQWLAMRTIEGSLTYASEEVRTRKVAEAALQEAQEDLERQVASRTEELARTVQALEAQAAELRVAREAQSRFLALVSHELRTPLTSVRASLGLLAHRQDLSAEARPLVEIAERNSLRLLNLTNELLDLEKAQSGQFEVRHEPVDLRMPVRGALDGVRSLAEERQIPITSALPDFPVVVTGDGPRLEQVCLNLLSNALKHAKGPGAVAVRLETREEGAWVGVSNPGDPIPDSFQDRIFQTFHQLEPEAGTSGLGLSLSKAIVDAHGGRIGFESGPEGTIFFFLLPRS